MSWSVWLQGKKEVVERELNDLQDASYAALRRINEMSGEIAVSLGGHGTESGGSYSVSVNVLNTPQAAAPGATTGNAAQTSTGAEANEAAPV